MRFKHSNWILNVGYISDNCIKPITYGKITNKYISVTSDISKIFFLCRDNIKLEIFLLLNKNKLWVFTLIGKKSISSTSLR